MLGREPTVGRATLGEAQNASVNSPQMAVTVNHWMSSFIRISIRRAEAGFDGRMKQPERLLQFNFITHKG